MAKRLYLGNLPYTSTAQDVRDFFSPRKVVDVELMVDRDTGRARGFGFVEMETDADAAASIAERNGQSIAGRAIVVSVANEKPRGQGGPGHRGGGRPARGRDYDGQSDND